MSSGSTPAAARPLDSNAKLLYQWQKQALTPIAAAHGADLDPETAAELCQLRALAWRQTQELDILKKPLPWQCSSCIISDPGPMSR